MPGTLPPAFVYPQREFQAISMIAAEPHSVEYSFRIAVVIVTGNGYILLISVVSFNHH
jgi:hypothetical protein